MRHKIRGLLLLIVALSAFSLVGNAQEVVPRGVTPRNTNARNTNSPNTPKEEGDKPKVNSQAEIDDDEEIPDSLLHPRWKIQRTVPITVDDLDQNAADLSRPENLKQQVEYNDTLDSYVFGNKMGNTWLNAPIMMSPQEYLDWSTRQGMRKFFRSKNNEIYQAKGKEKFDFTDMHFDLGPAEKIFGPGGVRIKTQGTAELKFGATIKNIENPSLPVRNRK